jgi:flagellar protein FlaG
MDMDVISGVNRTTESASPDVTRVDAGKAVAVQKTTAAPSNVTGQTGQTSGQESDAKQGMPFDGKDPAKSTIDSAVSSANNRMVSTRCEYSYDEATKRVSIKVFDKTSDKLIREVPPEESLEMLQKMWELAGLIVDEKR